MAANLNHSDHSDGEDVSMHDPENGLNSDDDNLSENLDQTEDTSMDASFHNINSPGDRNDPDLANGNSQNVQVT